jgi:hypothetical protein
MLWPNRATYRGVDANPPQFAELWLASKIFRNVAS